MFTKMKNIDTAFRSMHLLSICAITGSFLFSCYTSYRCYRFAMQVQSKLYILSNGKVLEAFASDRKDNIAVEARDHIKMFHTYFFTLDPDEKVIQSNITRALYLADGSAARQYNNLKETGYYNNIISGNISQQIIVDSVLLNLDSYPYYFRCHSTQRLTRPTSVVIRSLITEGFLRNVSRSDNNSHGFLIERWSTLDNKDLKTENRQ